MRLLGWLVVVSVRVGVGVFLDDGDATPRRRGFALRRFERIILLGVRVGPFPSGVVAFALRRVDDPSLVVVVVAVVVAIRLNRHRASSRTPRGGTRGRATHGVRAQAPQHRLRRLLHARVHLLAQGFVLRIRANHRLVILERLLEFPRVATRLRAAMERLDVPRILRDRRRRVLLRVRVKPQFDFRGGAIGEENRRHLRIARGDAHLHGGVVARHGVGVRSTRERLVTLLLQRRRRFRRLGPRRLRG